MKILPILAALGSMIRLLSVIATYGLVAFLLVSCSTTPKPSAAEVADPTPAESNIPEGWYVVSEKPVVIYPKGYPKDGSTQFSDVEWVQTNGGQFRWLIPKKGIEGRATRDELTQEVFAMRTSIETYLKTSNIPWSNPGELALKTVIGVPWFTAASLALALGQAGGGMHP